MENVKVVFIAWQDLDSRKFFPVARLSHVSDGANDGYEFTYVNGVKEAVKHGFHPFLAFPKVEGSYRSSELFPFFANRVISSSRDDYRAYVKDLGLDPQTASPLAVLARTGGRRATDSIEIYACPQYDSRIDGYLAYFFAHGLRYMPTSAQERIERLTSNERLFILHDLQNPADPHALLIRTQDYVPVGFVPRYFIPDTWELLTSCSYIKLFVQQVNPTPAPVQQRILCRMQACWPDDFAPCKDELHQPISKEGVSAR